MFTAAGMHLSPTHSKSVQLHFSYFDILWFDILRVSCKGVMWSNICALNYFDNFVEYGEGI